MTSKHIPILWFYYGLTITLIIIGCISLYNTHVYIQHLVSAGKLVIIQQASQVLISYMESCVSYFSFAAILYGIAQLLYRKQQLEIVPIETTLPTEELEEELDTFIHEVKKTNE